MPRNKKNRNADEQLLLNEIQLLLAEKRTYYSMLRTGLAVFTVPLTIIAFLLATIEFHTLFRNFWVGFITIATLLTVALIGLSIFYRAEAKIKRLNQIIRVIEQENKRIAEIIV